jgi:hypothetical protein
VTDVHAAPANDMTLIEAVQRTGAGVAFEKALAYSTAAQDAVVDTRIVRMAHLGGDRKDVVLTARTPGGDLTIEVGDTAHRQLAEKVGIDWKYYDRMRQGQPDLLAANVNRWLEVEPNRHLLRMLRPIGDEDGRRMKEIGASYRLRAVLSSKYRPLDNAALLNTILPIAAEHGARVAEFNFGDDRFHLRLVGAERTLDEIRKEYGNVGVHTTRPDGKWIADGEVVSFGISIRNSETGFGSMRVEPFARIVRCLNGIIVAENYRAIHVGRDKEDGFLQEDTKRLEDAAVFMRVRDKAIELFGPESRFKVARAIEAGVNNALNLPPELPLFEFLGNVGAKFDLTEKETEILKEEVVQDMAVGRYETGVNAFAVSQGMTALARRVGEDDFDRRRELEVAGWEILTSPVEKLLKAGKAGSN